MQNDSFFSPVIASLGSEQVGEYSNFSYLRFSKIRAYLHINFTKSLYIYMYYIDCGIIVFRIYYKVSLFLNLLFIFSFSTGTPRRRWRCWTGSTWTQRSPARRRSPRGSVSRTSTLRAESPGGSKLNHEYGRCLTSPTLQMRQRYICLSGLFLMRPYYNLKWARSWISGYYKGL